MVEGIIPSEIGEEPEAIRRTLTTSRPAARRVAERLRTNQTSRLFLIGNGTSFHTCLAGASEYRRHARPEDPAVVPMTAGEFITYPPAFGAADALIAVSASGEFRDVIQAVERVKGQMLTIGIIHVAESTLAHAADEVIVSDGGPSRVPVMTKTFASTLVATQLLLAELLSDDDGNTFVESASEAADQAASAIMSASVAVDSLARRLKDFEHVFVVGAGAGSIAAMEAALKLKEMSLVHAEAAEAWEMESGAATIIGGGTAVIALALEGSGKATVTNVARHAADWGAHVIGVADAPLFDGSDLLPVPAAASEAHSSLVAVPPVALLAYVLGGQRGATPDNPAWVSRYHSQGLFHILGSELGT